MAKPTLLLAAGSQKVPTLVRADGTPLWPLAIGEQSNTYDDKSGWTGVATHVQGVNPGANDGYVAIAGYDGTGTPAIRRILADSNGRMLVDAQRRRAVIAVTPVVSLTAYSLKDAIGAALTFTGAARTGILTGRLEAVTVSDKSQQMPQLDLVLFSASYTAPTDNAVFDPTDAELLTIIGVVPIVTADWKDFNDNSIAHKQLLLPYVLAGTVMYGGLVARGTPTFVSTSDITVTLTVSTD